MGSCYTDWTKVDEENYGFESSVEMLASDLSRMFIHSGDVTSQNVHCRDVMSIGRQSSVTDKSSSLSCNKGDRYKTELCRTYEENGCCRYGDKCQFAHGVGELRTVVRHPKYKTDLCRTFHTTGFCPYGARCHFIHGEQEKQQKQTTPITSSISSSSVQRKTSVESMTSRDDVSRLLGSLDDDLLLALASLIQRRQMASCQQPTVAANDCCRTNSGVDMLHSLSFNRSGSTSSPSPCPSPNSVFGSGSSDGLSSPVCSNSPLVNPLFRYPLDSSSSCGSPDLIPLSAAWNLSTDVRCTLSSSRVPPSTCQQTSTYTRSHLLNGAVRSIFA